MRRRAVRAVFASALLLVAVALGAAALAILGPERDARPALVPLAVLETLPRGEPVRVTSTFLAGLDLKAQRERGAGFGFGRPRGTVKALPVYLVREGDGVRGLIGIDPRNGCEVKLFQARDLPWGSFPPMLEDVCHGSEYDFAGHVIGGPSPWELDRLVLTVRGGRVYASTSDVTPGRWIAP